MQQTSPLEIFQYLEQCTISTINKYINETINVISDTN